MAIVRLEQLYPWPGRRAQEDPRPLSVRPRVGLGPGRVAEHGRLDVRGAPAPGADGPAVPVRRPRRQRQPGHRLEAGPRPRAGRARRGRHRRRGPAPGHRDPGAIAGAGVHGRAARSELTMAAVPITVPGVGESITEGILARWLKPDGSAVKAGEPLFELETDKASNVVPAAVSGVLKIAVAEGETVAIGATVGTIDPKATPAPATPAAAARARLQRATAGARARPRPPACRSRRPSAGSWPRRRSIPPGSRPPAAADGSPRETSWRTSKPPQPRPLHSPRRPPLLPHPARRHAAPARLRRSPRDPPADERPPPADRPAPGRGPADRRHPDDLQRGRHVARHGPPRAVQGALQDEARRRRWASCRSSSRRRSRPSRRSPRSTAGSTATRSSTTTSTTSAWPSAPTRA